MWKCAGKSEKIEIPDPYCNKGDDHATHRCGCRTAGSVPTLSGIVGASGFAASEFTRLRDRMVDVQLAGRGIVDPLVLKAMRTVPREMFVDEALEGSAYEDSALPIDAGQTISQPYIVARMIEAATLDRDSRVLEVGTGSGYAAAVMSRIASLVHTIERHAALGEVARRRFVQLGYRNIEVRTGDGTRGWPEHSPFDAIIVAAAGPNVPLALKQQLAIGGNLVLPVGGAYGGQTLCKIARLSELEFERTDLDAVSFVPLIFGRE
jgi:protein-L-isoaspartate(D-aspartate) O-methyltransferase